MAVASELIRNLLENGAHFGHQTNKWNPKMAPYIFGEKSGIYIIDLRKTEEALIKAREFLKGISASGKNVLFVGTKKQAKKIIRSAAQRCGMYFVDERWLGGCLTNFSTIRRSVDKLNQIQEKKSSEIYESFAKKEKARIDRIENKLLKNLEGIRDMDKLPDCLFVVDSDAEDIAVREAKKIGIPVVAIIDTNCDPDPIDYLVPANDDAIRSIHFIVNEIADAIEEGRKMYDGIKVRTPVREKEETESKPEGVVVEEINIEEKKTGETAEETAKDKETTEEGEATEEKETPGAGETSREATESEPAVEPEQEPEQEEELSVDEAGDIKLSDTDK